jgi:hypothetical protein
VAALVEAVAVVGGGHKGSHKGRPYLELGHHELRASGTSFCGFGLEESEARNAVRSLRVSAVGRAPHPSSEAAKNQVRTKLEYL